MTERNAALSAFKEALPYTLPVFAGFWFIAFAYGFYMYTLGFSFLYPLFMAMFIYLWPCSYLEDRLNSSQSRCCFPHLPRGRHSSLPSPFRQGISSMVLLCWKSMKEWAGKSPPSSTGCAMRRLPSIIQQRFQMV